MTLVEGGFSGGFVNFALTSFELGNTLITNAVFARGLHVQWVHWLLAKRGVGELGIAHDARARGGRLAQSAGSLIGVLATRAGDDGRFGSNFTARHRIGHFKDSSIFSVAHFE
jgi:hypothetical protein